MSDISKYSGNQETSPRSTILTAKASSMTSALPLIINESNVSKEALPSQGKAAGSDQNKIDSKSCRDTLKSNPEPKEMESSDLNTAKSFDNEASPTPISHEYSSYMHYSNATPSQQPIPGYYVYPTQTHLIPDPESPGGNRLIGSYDVGSFFQAHSGAAFHPTNASPNAMLQVGRSNTANLSPSKGPSSSAAIATPTSPLFARVSSGSMMRTDGMNPLHGAPPALPYITSTQLAPNLYPMYPATGITSSSSDDGTWAGQTTDARNQNSYQQVQYGVPPTRRTSGGRSYSIDESMLPPSIFEDQVNSMYSPYQGGQVNHGSPSGFAPHLSWTYPQQDMYISPTSPLQPRPTVQVGMIPNSPGTGMRPGQGFGPNYMINSPGQPIQTTALNKGPDGANLFIFHIPNHYTNLDMYHLFLPYGNLLSVRIMVERDTGRSRGFGFVSYDSAESAALAIKELNGYPIGNKRLKVQHKQIRRNDLIDDDGFNDGFHASANFQRDPSLPPSIAPSESNWYASSSTIGKEEEILNDDDDDDDDDVSPRPTAVEERPAELAHSSALTTLGQLKHTLPNIPPSHRKEAQE